MKESRPKKRRNRLQGILFESVQPTTDTSFYESRLKEEGAGFVAGVDEVGRGSLAGPVLAAAVILPYPCDIKGIADSKKLSPTRREALAEEIVQSALSIGFGIVEHSEIDEINILNAVKKAMKIAVESLSIRPDYLLIDGSHAIPVNIPQLIIPKGDVKSISIAAASIVAKVKRDRMMRDLEASYPDFSFSIHKGYGTALHLSEIKRHGPSKIHRLSFNMGI